MSENSKLIIDATYWYKNVSMTLPNSQITLRAPKRTASRLLVLQHKNNKIITTTQDTMWVLACQNVLVDLTDLEYSHLTCVREYILALPSPRLLCVEFRGSLNNLRSPAIYLGSSVHVVCLDKTSLRSATEQEISITRRSVISIWTCPIGSHNVLLNIMEDCLRNPRQKNRCPFLWRQKFRLCIHGNSKTNSGN